MKRNILNHVTFVMVATALLSVGYVQPSAAGILTTQQIVRADHRQNTISRLEATLLREDVAAQLVEYGVEPSAVMARVDNMTIDELNDLEGRINDQVAGADAVGIIGAVFLVLLVLELVGITDVFKKL